MRRTLFTLTVCALLSSAAAAPGPHADQPARLPGLQAAAEVSRDTFGIAHIRAGNDHDLYFMQGYVHAQDRLFQMDDNRRQRQRHAGRTARSRRAGQPTSNCARSASGARPFGRWR